MPASASSASAEIFGNKTRSETFDGFGAYSGKRLVFDTALPSCPLAIKIPKVE
jgi:hypothetical protein